MQTHRGPKNCAEYHRKQLGDRHQSAEIVNTPLKSYYRENFNIIIIIIIIIQIVTVVMVTHQVLVQGVNSAVQAKWALSGKNPQHYLWTPCCYTPQTVDASIRWTCARVKKLKYFFTKTLSTFACKYSTLNAPLNRTFPPFPRASRLGVYTIIFWNMRTLGIIFGEVKTSNYEFWYPQGWAGETRLKLLMVREKKSKQTQIYFPWILFKDTIQNLKLSCVRVLTYWLNIDHIWSARWNQNRYLATLAFTGMSRSASSKRLCDVCCMISR